MKCSIKPRETDDGLFWILPHHSECKDFYCNFKHDSSRIRYKKLKCGGGDEFEIASDFFTGNFVPDPTRDEFICPTLAQGICPVPTPGVVHPLPMTKESSEGQRETLFMILSYHFEEKTLTKWLSHLWFVNLLVDLINTYSSSSSQA